MAESKDKAEKSTELLAKVQCACGDYYSTVTIHKGQRKQHERGVNHQSWLKNRGSLTLKTMFAKVRAKTLSVPAPHNTSVRPFPQYIQCTKLATFVPLNLLHLVISSTTAEEVATATVVDMTASAEAENNVTTSVGNATVSTYMYYIDQYTVILYSSALSTY